ncbi:response regulator [Alteromonas sp. 5E99-2]|uniref:response regulator n=1 Tax=Alteromonas sp. 5E99-2 TaxID=2817683 RepID=UPI001A986842|nr:response regulator [Alteromonas sp. 5E99-2]MBO1255462.1 response regulator [Alteromonas sp. 5E99-2]
MIKIPAQKTNSELNVLIIDGQALVHSVVKAALLDVGMKNIHSAYNAYSALNLCEKTSFDMILIAFDVKCDKDGFNILEEMKHKGFITKTTIVIFLSADTSQGLVNCVMEMEPTDFWVKPLDRQKVVKRIGQILLIEKKLYALRYCFEQEEYATAIYYAERQLKDESLVLYFPHINRMIGRCLFNLKEYQGAQEFYEKLAQVDDYAWIQVGLASTLLKLNKIDEATLLTDSLLKREDTKFAIYDLLAEHHLEQENFKLAYEIIQEATKLAPRSIERNKKSWNLARLNHDRLGQYIATKNIAKYAKNSIHDSPKLTLDMIRSGIDLAATLPESEANKLTADIESKIERLKQSFGAASELGEQLDIVNVRLLNLCVDKKQAEKAMQIHLKAQMLTNFEDNLDKVKAFHEVGMWEQSMQLLDNMKEYVDNDSFTGKVLTEYLEQESKERQDIRYNPKELGEMASVHYKNRRYKPAYNLLRQASQLSPSNANISISLLKVLAIIAEESGLTDEEREEFESCIDILSSSQLTENQQTALNGYQERIEESLKVTE